MKYNKRNNEQSKKQTSRKWLIGLVVVAILAAIGVVSAVSKQDGQDLKVEEARGQMANKSTTYVTSNAAGQLVAVNRQTGQARPLTPEEAHNLAEGIKQLVNQSTDGLVQIHRADGSVSMNLQGRFQSVLLAKKEDDGTISQACVDNVDSAAAFFEIDPALLGSATPISKTPGSLKPEIR
jgi:type II secretory pathway pseudopilin PulG